VDAATQLKALLAVQGRVQATLEETQRAIRETTPLVEQAWRNVGAALLPAADAKTLQRLADLLEEPSLAPAAWDTTRNQEETRLLAEAADLAAVCAGVDPVAAAALAEAAFSGARRIPSLQRCCRMPRPASGSAAGPSSNVWRRGWR
jgi:hypothetical protein